MTASTIMRQRACLNRQSGTGVKPEVLKLMVAGRVGNVLQQIARQAPQIEQPDLARPGSQLLAGTKHSPEHEAHMVIGSPALTRGQ